MLSCCSIILSCCHFLQVAYNWLPPLLAPIYEDRTTLSVPVIDGINADDFSINPVYAAGSHSRGIFEWGMLYKACRR